MKRWVGVWVKWSEVKWSEVKWRLKLCRKQVTVYSYAPVSLTNRQQDCPKHDLQDATLRARLLHRIIRDYFAHRGNAVAQSRHCAASKKVAGSITYRFTGDTILPAALWSWPTQPLREISTRNISCGGEMRSVLKAVNLTTFLCWVSWHLGASNSWHLQGLSRTVQGLIYILIALWN